MKCPRCESPVLEERERDGVTTDVCQQCRGVWLDRGELEKLIARASDEQNEFERQRAYDRDDDDDDDHERHKRHDGQPGQGDPASRGGRGRKRRWYESLTDMFD